MNPEAFGAPVAAVVTAVLAYLGARHMARLERLREEARLAEAARDEATALEQSLSAAHDQARAALIAERNELLGRWQRTLDEAREERRRLVQEHRIEITRLRHEARDELAAARESARLVITELRAQVAELRDGPKTDPTQRRRRPSAGP